MTNRATPVAALLLLALGTLVSLPVASAHGTPEAREIDTRVLEEGLDLLLDYGSTNGLLEDACGADFQDCAGLGPLPILYEGGHDLLTLDLREAYGPAASGALEPGLWTRHTFRRGSDDVTLTDVISFTLNGTAVELEMTSMDNQVFTSTTFTYVSEKYDEGEYERGLQGFIPYSALGTGPGATLTDITVTSFVDGSPTDVMPGAYSYNGMLVPDTHGLADATIDQDYTLAGPAPLVTGAFDGFAELQTGTNTVTLNVASTLSQTPQTVAIQVLDAAGFTITPAQDLLQFEAGGGAQTVDLTVDTNGVEGHAMAMLRLVSDLGGVADVQLHASVPVTVIDAAVGTAITVAPGEHVTLLFDEAGDRSLHVDGGPALPIFFEEEEGAADGHDHMAMESGDTMEEGTDDAMPMDDAMAGMHSMADDALETVTFNGTSFDMDHVHVHVGGEIRLVNAGTAPLSIMVEDGAIDPDAVDSESAPGIGLVLLLGAVALAGVVARRK